MRTLKQDLDHARIELEKWQGIAGSLAAPSSLTLRKLAFWMKRTAELEQEATEGTEAEETRFQQWFGDWRSIFANEVHAREIFKMAQPTQRA